MDTLSQSSQQSSMSRSQRLLDQIRSQTPKEISDEFFATLKLYKTRQIDTQEVFQRVQMILADYPTLWGHFVDYIPPTAKPTPLLSPALEFVNQVKRAYRHNPQIYEEFTILLRDCQRGQRSKTEVKEAVGLLLHATPELVVQFEKFYQQDPQLSRTDSNATLELGGPLTVSEATPLVRDVESGQIKRSWTPWILSFLFLVVSGSIATLYFLGYLSIGWNGPKIGK
jgi:histone deacetylase complex regulatory component SIN3